MKTTNNVRKTTLNTLAAATGLVILSFGVNAQGASKSLFENPEKNHIAMVTGETDNYFTKSLAVSGNLTGTEVYAAYLTEETEEPLHLEDWMMSETNFVSTLNIETESPLEIEDWMTNESNFDVSTFSMEVETEQELNVESWMLDENKFTVKENNNNSNNPKVNSKVFSTSTFYFHDVVIESRLSVEDWMTNPKVWSK